MALIPFITASSYDTSVQTAQLYQVVYRLSLGDGSAEKCAVTGICLDEQKGYTYTLIGLESLKTFFTRFIRDERDSCSGFAADMRYPVFLAESQMEDLRLRAIAAAEARDHQAAAEGQYLNRSATIVEYSERCLAIFTSDANDVKILESIRAKRNLSLTYQGRKVAGWIFPKYRQEQLAAVVKLA